MPSFTTALGESDLTMQLTGKQGKIWKVQLHRVRKARHPEGVGTKRRVGGHHCSFFFLSSSGEAVCTALLFPAAVSFFSRILLCR